MNWHFLALSLLFGICLCSKRPADHLERQSPKKIKLISVEETDTDLLIYEVLRTNDARFISQQIAEPNFVAGFKVSHLFFTLNNCLPDVLNVILCEPVIKQLNDNPIFCKFMFRDLFKQSMDRKQSVVKLKMLIQHIDPDYGLFTSGRELQTIYGSIIDKYISSKNIVVSEVDRRILWLIGLHFSFLDLMFFWEHHVNTEAINQDRPYYARWMHALLIALDTGDDIKIREVLDACNCESNESSLLRLVVGEALVDASRYDLLPSAHATFANMFNNARPSESYASILKKSIIDEQVPAVYGYISDVAFIPSLPILLSPIVVELIDEADIYGLFKAIPVFTMAKPSQNGFMRLAAHVMAGDWRFLLVFMELHPNRIMISDRAWDILWRERRTDGLLLAFAH